MDTPLSNKAVSHLVGFIDLSMRDSPEIEDAPSVVPDVCRNLVRYTADFSL